MNSEISVRQMSARWVARILQSLRALIIFSVIFGGLYPVSIYLLGQLFFPKMSKGSIVFKDGKPVGSELIAQKFTSPKYFWPRPSSQDYETLPSGASQWSGTKRDLRNKMMERKAALEKANADAGGGKNDPYPPADLLTNSGSGLDPHISIDAAMYQVHRIAKARGYDDQKEKELGELVKKKTERAWIGVIGRNRVNVLLLNLSLE